MVKKGKPYFNDSDDPDDLDKIQEKNINAPSASGTRKVQNVLELITEKDICIEQNVILKRVKYETNKRSIIYIGQVEKVNKSLLIHVNFLRKKTSMQKENSIYI